VGQAVVGLLKDAAASVAELTGTEFKLYQATDFQRPMPHGISLYLYRVAPATRRNLPPRPRSDGTRPRPPTVLDLHYLLTPWGRSAEKQHEILGWAVRTLQDTPTLTASVLNQRLPAPSFLSSESVELFLDSLSIQDMSSVWDVGKPNVQVSVPYVVRQVVIESTMLMTEAEPVQTRRFEVGEGEQA
jgi:hypothetical protein